MYKSLSLALFALVLFAAFTLLPVPAAEAQISVVVNKESTYELDESSVKSIFAAAQLKWPDGEKILVIDQSSNDTGKAFYKAATGKSVNQIRMRWTKLVLSGQATAPKKCANDAEVLKSVAADKYAIGFVQSSKVDGTVKEVLKF